MVDFGKFYDGTKFLNNPPVIEPSNISGKISEIISKRNSKVMEINELLNGLNHMSSVLSSFATKRAEFLLLHSDSTFENFSKLHSDEINNNIAEVSDDKIEDIQAGIREVERATIQFKSRIDKDTVSIGVVGGARVGKSTLLRAITGLDEALIPTSGDNYCTGVQVLIENANEFRVEVEFYSKKDFFNDVIGEYKRYYSEFGTEAISIENFADVEKLYMHLNNQRDLPSPQYLKPLKDYLDKRSNYEFLLDSTPQVLDEHQKAEIRDYISQISLDGNTKCFKFMAVKNVRILCKFPDKRVSKLVLVDTIGLGEVSLGKEKKMLELISKEVDFVFLLRKMSKNSEVILGDKDIDLYFKIARSKKAAPSKWLYWVFNRNNNDYTPQIFDRDFENAVKYNEKYSGNLNPAGILNIDCTNQNGVWDNLIMPALSHMSQNLSSVDTPYIEEINTLLREKVNVKFQQLMGKIKTVTVPKVEKREFIINEFNNAHKKLTLELNKYVEDCAVDLSVTIPHIELREIANMFGNAVVSESDIKYKWETSNYLMALNEAFDKTRSNLLNLVENNRVDLTNEMKQFKIDVAQKFLNVSNLDSCVSVDYVSDENIFATIADKLFGNIDICSALKKIFLDLNKFDIQGEVDVSGRLKKAMDKYLNVNENPPDAPTPFPVNWTKSDMNAGCLDIWNVLQNQIVFISEEFIDEDKQPFLRVPAERMVTELKTFVKQIINQLVIDGWRYVYEDNAGVIWKECLDELEKNSKQLKEWNDLTLTIVDIRTISELDSRTNY